MNTLNENLNLLMSSTHIIIEIIECKSEAMVTKTLIKKTEEHVSVSSSIQEEMSFQKSIPFDTYVQVIEGTADLTIDQQVRRLKLGEGVIIPAYSAHNFNSNGHYKILSTILKTGYDQKAMHASQNIDEY